MPQPREDFPRTDGSASRKQIQDVIDPRGDIYSGMTKREAIADGKHAPVQNMPRGNSRATIQKR